MYTKERIQSILEASKNDKVCIAIDWLSIYFKHKGQFEEKYEESDQIQFSKDCYLLAINRPTHHFSTHFVLFYKKEECAHILMNSQNEKFFKKDIVKVEFSNHAFYSGVWKNVLNEIEKFGLTYHCTGRLDIAIDGVNYLHDILNIYAKQTLADRVMFLKNSTEKRARFNAKILNPKTLNFENFNIGAHGGNKMITLYNKTLEIAKSGKKYIQDFWIKNGVLITPNDLERQNKEIKQKEKKEGEVFRIEGIDNIYRFEIRLKSECIKELKDFDLSMLFTSKGLANIVRTHCRKYFEACFNDDSNRTRCTTIDLLPYDKLEAVLMEKIQRVEKDGLYKAKLTIHGLIQDTYKGYIQTHNYNEIIETITDRAQRYNLFDYLNKKIPEWHIKYHKNTDESRVNEVTIIINRIQQITDEHLQVDRELSERHNQADATGAFGE